MLGSSTRNLQTCLSANQREKEKQTDTDALWSWTQRALITLPTQRQQDVTGATAARPTSCHQAIPERSSSRRWRRKESRGAKEFKRLQVNDTHGELEYTVYTRSVNHSSDWMSVSLTFRPSCLDAATTMRGWISCGHVQPKNKRTFMPLMPLGELTALRWVILTNSHQMAG